MRSTACALLAVSFASCLPPPRPEQAATIAVPFDEHEIDCLSEETRDEIARGQVMAEAAIAACELKRKQEAETFQLQRDDWAKKSAEAEGLRVWATIAKTSLGLAVGVIVVEGIVFVLQAVKR